MRFSRRFWMTTLLGVIVLMIPLAWVLMAAVSAQGAAAKREWLLWIMLYLATFLGLLAGLLLLTLGEIREVLKGYYSSRRDALRDTVEQLREDYHQRQRMIQGNGNQRKRS